MKDVEIRDASRTDAQQPSRRWCQGGPGDPERPHRADAARAKRSSSWLYKLQQNERSHNSRPHPVPSSISPPRMSNTPIPCGPALAPRLINGIGKGSHLLEPCVWVWGTPARSSSHLSVEIFFGRLPINKQPVFCFFLQWVTFWPLVFNPPKKGGEEEKKKSSCFWFRSLNERVLKKINSRRNKGRAVGCFSVASSISVMTEAFPWSVLHESSLERLCSVFLFSQP